MLHDCSEFVLCIFIELFYFNATISQTANLMIECQNRQVSGLNGHKTIQEGQTSVALVLIFGKIKVFISFGCQNKVFFEGAPPVNG